MTGVHRYLANVLSLVQILKIATNGRQSSNIEESAAVKTTAKLPAGHIMECVSLIMDVNDCDWFLV